MRQLSFAVVENGIYYVFQPTTWSSRGFEIRFLNVATGKDQILYRSEMIGFQGLAVSPDRNTILYCATAAMDTDQMLVENFR